MKADAFSRELPHLFCRRCDFGELVGDPGSLPWSQISPVSLCDVVTGDAPIEGTQIRAGWSDTELRILFVAEDTKPWATLTQRDAPLYTEEVVEVFLDPVGDLESYFEIEVNPLNAVCDLVLRRTRSGYLKDFTWDCEGLRTKVAVKSGSWATEMAVPFSSLGSSPAIGDRWRVNFCRIDRPTPENRCLSAWSPTGMELFHVQNCFGVLEFA